MTTDLIEQKEQAHVLLDLLEPEKLAAVVRLLQVMVEPVSLSRSEVALDEEEITPETAQALERAKASLARGEGIPHEQIMREFGLNQ